MHAPVAPHSHPLLLRHSVTVLLHRRLPLPLLRQGPPADTRAALAVSSHPHRRQCHQAAPHIAPSSCRIEGLCRVYHCAWRHLQSPIRSRLLLYSSGGCRPKILAPHLPAPASAPAPAPAQPRQELQRQCRHTGCRLSSARGHRPGPQGSPTCPRRCDPEQSARSRKQPTQ